MIQKLKSKSIFIKNPEKVYPLFPFQIFHHSETVQDNIIFNRKKSKIRLPSQMLGESRIRTTEQPLITLLTVD